MRTVTLLILLLISTSSFAQIFNQATIPSGYTNAQLRIRNDATIDNNNNYWIAFQRIGLGKYDGTTWTMYNTGNGLLPSDTVTSV